MSSSLQISISNDAWQNHFLSSLRNLRNRNSLCDAKLITQDGETSRAHAIVLAASSPVLYSLLTGSGPQYTLKLQQVCDKNVMQHILDFIYEGQITIPIKLLMEVHLAADKLHISQLSDVCLAILKEMGLGPKQDAKINTVPSGIPLTPLAVPPPSNPCVLKVPAIPNPAHNQSANTANGTKSVKSAKPLLPANPSDDQAIDLSIVKIEKPESECPSSLAVHDRIAEESLADVNNFPESPSTVAMPISLVRTRPTEDKENRELPPKSREDIDKILERRNSMGLPYNAYTPPPMDSPLQICLSPSSENNNVSKFTDEMRVKQESILEMRGQSVSPAQDEDDELIEEMVAEQLLQSRMQRSLGKQPKGMKRFHCRICDSRFTRLDNLRVHIRSIHTGKKPFRCNICDKTFTRAFTLKYHKMSHDGVKPWTCSDCGRGFTRKDYHQEHIRNQICKKGKSASNLSTKTNSRTSSPVQDDAHQCQICEAFFQSQDSLENHMEDCMNETPKWESKNQSMNSEDPDQDEQDDSECICDVCNIRFLDRDSLFVHQMEHKRQDESMKIEMIAPDAPDGSPCKISRQDEQNLESIKKQMSSRSQISKIRVGGENCLKLSEKKAQQLPSSLRELLCEEEEKISSNLQSQTLPFSNQCNILDLRRSSPQSDENENLTNDLSLKNHNSPRMPSKKQKLTENFNCSQENLNSLLSLTKRPFGFINCFNETDENSSMNLLNEMKEDSDGEGYPPRKKIKQEQPYSCDICNARFTRGDNMRVHRRRHFNAAKMFTCADCGQAFTRSSSLKTHMTAAHNIM